MISGFAHVAIYTGEFDKTVSFYKEAFDAKEVGYPHTTRRCTLLSLGEDILEVFESESMEDGVIKHFALECDNTEEAYHKAIVCGARPLVEPKDIEVTLNNKQGESVNYGTRVAFVRGFAGEQIEFWEKINR